MENEEEINVVTVNETFLHCADQPDFPQIKVEQQGNIMKKRTGTNHKTVQKE